jgi:hypothetical protein
MRAVPATGTPPGFLPDTWAGSETVQLDRTPLGQINQLATGQVTLTVPSSLAGDPGPEVPLTMLTLRVRLLLASTPSQVRDSAWRHIGLMARAERGEWNLFALGLAYPGLRARAWRLTEGMTLDQTAQVHYRLAGDFLLALHRLDLSRPNIAARLIGTAYDQASGRKHRAVPVTASHAADAAATSAAWPQPGPRSVLDHLVRQSCHAADGERLTALGAELIARTYLEGEKLKDVAASLNLSESSASKHRTRAAAAIARHLGRARTPRHEPGTLRHGRTGGRFGRQPAVRPDTLVFQRHRRSGIQLAHHLPRLLAVIIDLQAMAGQIIKAHQHQAGERQEREHQAPPIGRRPMDIYHQRPARHRPDLAPDLYRRWGLPQRGRGLRG